MDLLTDLSSILVDLGIPHETGAHTDPAPDTYAILTPVDDTFAVQGDGHPLCEAQEVRISLFCRRSYLALKRRIEHAVLAAEMTITSRRYVRFETDTKYHHYAIDVANLYHYEMEEQHGSEI